MPEKDKNKKTIEAYDKNPQFYAGRFESYGARIEDVDRALKLNESGCNKVLELGCGNGRDAEYIVSRIGVDNYTGVDASLGLINLAREKIPKGEFHVKDMRKIDYKPEDIEKLCPYNFFVVYKNIQDIRGQSWFEIALRKI